MRGKYMCETTEGLSLPRCLQTPGPWVWGNQLNPFVGGTMDDDEHHSEPSVFHLEPFRAEKWKPGEHLSRHNRYKMPYGLADDWQPRLGTRWLMPRCLAESRLPYHSNATPCLAPVDGYHGQIGEHLEVFFKEFKWKGTWLFITGMNKGLTNRNVLISDVWCWLTGSMHFFSLGLERN